MFCHVGNQLGRWPRSGNCQLEVPFRSGTGAQILGTIPLNSTVNLLECNGSGSWCAVEFEGQTGFVSGKYLTETSTDPGQRWPRALGLEGDAFVVLYELQFSSWENFATLDALVAAEFRETKEAAPIFWLIGLRGTTVLDADKHRVVISDIAVTQNGLRRV